MIPLYNADNLKRRDLFWRAKKAINLSESHFTKEEAKTLRDLCMKVWDADTVADAELACQYIEEYCRAIVNMDKALQLSTESLLTIEERHKSTLD